MKTYGELGKGIVTFMSCLAFCIIHRNKRPIEVFFRDKIDTHKNNVPRVGQIYYTLSWTSELIIYYVDIND